MIVISHRGSNRKAPENSLEAFNLSIDEGAKRIELDLWLSKDGEIFICHDDKLARTTSSKALISKSSSAELKKVVLENGESLPSLTDVLPLLDKVELNLELKGTNLKLVDATLKQILNHKLQDKIILSSFNVEILEKCAQDAPKIKRAFLWEPTLSDKISIDLERIKEGLKRSKTHIFHPQASYYNEKLFKFAKFEDLEVYTWAALRKDETINECKLWKDLIKHEVDGHCTNYPLELNNFLREQIIKGRL